MDERVVQYEEKKQSPIVAYFLLVVFGVLGAHNFYLGRREQGIGQFAFTGLIGVPWLWFTLSFTSSVTGLGLVAGLESGGLDDVVRRATIQQAVGMIWLASIFAWLMVNALEVPKLVARHNLRLYRRIFGE